MNWTSTAVIRTQSTWTVKAECTTGECAEVECTSEAQARFFAAVLALKPMSLPKASIVRRLAALDERAPHPDPLPALQGEGVLTNGR